MKEISGEFPTVNEIPAGTKFRIILPEDHRTGYTWQLKDDYKPSVVQRINEVWHGNEKGLYFHLQALATGQTTLHFTNRNFTDTSDIKHFVIKVTPR
jgi:predicted secreted protein